ncbi:hypothetical protein Krad_2400 [Kineococcus radiotolerans SRS30216 = ATCC BAA-149]|uniref:Uncharacterized protein n=1 Tax=Kineococcus radiotolerans (strain ATCC BAA-149 / DSM 14245 / SRS30216) TaxID=266940 RepID=A6WAP1_KINRD|nr:hypothetical protein Krad_2400 [Kineococcus radiotolerans SRS30216 = ATCC BAA-149]
MSARSSRALRHLRPRQVPGYAEAVAQRRTPQVPSTPPQLLPGPSAHRLEVRLLLGGVPVFAVSVWLIFFLSRGGHGGWLGSGLVLLVGLAPFAWVAHGWKAVGRRNIEELQHGYTTTVMRFGQFHVGGGGHVRDTDAGPPWDYSGTWVLQGDGRVKSVPRPGVEPPGMYPSPVRAGAEELWTGASWTGYYRA